MNAASILWVGAAFAGFLVWWPIGAAFLSAIVITAISQQITGYQLPQEQPKSVGDAYVASLRLERQTALQQQTAGLLAHEKSRQIKQVKVLAITDQSKKK